MDKDYTQQNKTSFPTNEDTSGWMATWKRLPWQAIIMAFAALFLIRNIMTSLAADDYSYAFIWAFATGVAVTGWASVIMSIWLVGGFIILSIGIAGIYIANIYREVKHRPLYHIMEILQ